MPVIDGSSMVAVPRIAMRPPTPLPEDPASPALPGVVVPSVPFELLPVPATPDKLSVDASPPGAVPARGTIGRDEVGG